MDRATRCVTPSCLRAVHKALLAMINPVTKFEVSMFTNYDDMKGNVECRNWVVWELGVTQAQRQCCIR